MTCGRRKTRWRRQGQHDYIHRRRQSQRWKGGTTKINSEVTTKYTTAATAGIRYYGVIFDVDATNAIGGGGVTTEVGDRYRVNRGGATAWGERPEEEKETGEDTMIVTLVDKVTATTTAPSSPTTKVSTVVEDGGKGGSTEGGVGYVRDGGPLRSVVQGGVVANDVLNLIV